MVRWWRGLLLYQESWEGFKVKMYLVSLKIFCFESGADKKKSREGFVWNGFWHNLFHGKDIDYNVMLQKIVYFVVSWL